MEMAAVEGGGVSCEVCFNWESIEATPEPRCFGPQNSYRRRTAAYDPNIEFYIFSTVLSRERGGTPEEASAAVPLSLRVFTFL